jgi:LPXTG-site transpeptidase (sortase) family protein
MDKPLNRAWNAADFRALPFFIYFFGILGILTLCYWVSVYYQAHVYQKRALRDFNTAPHRQPAHHLKAGSGIAILSIPRLGMSSLVVEGTDDDELKVAPGHIPGTAFPGTSGNIGLAGHRDTFFRPLRNIHMGDTITLATRERTFQYRVASTEVVRPRDVRVLGRTTLETLTLVTCYPFNFVGSAPKRFIVHAICENCAQ